MAATTSRLPKIYKIVRTRSFNFSKFLHLQSVACLAQNNEKEMKKYGKIHGVGPMKELYNQEQSEKHRRKWLRDALKPYEQKGLGIGGA